MWSHRIIAPQVNSTLYNGLWSDSRSGHFTQLWEGDGEDKEDSDWVTDNGSVMSDGGESDE